MGLKILHSADWHLGSAFGGLREDQSRILREAQWGIPDQILELAKRHGCDLMLLAGDLLEENAGPEAVTLLKRVFQDFGRPVFIAPGNHDYCVSGSPWLEEQWPENVTIFKGSMESVALENLDCRVYGAAFRGMDCPSLLENFQAECGETYKLGVLHGDPTQKNSHYNPVTAAQVRSSGLTYLALGHVHSAGAFAAGHTYCAWPGCPMGRGWDETGNKGVCLVTLGDQAGQVDIQAVRLNTPRFLELDVDIEQGTAQAIAAALPAAPGMDFYRLNLVGCGKVDLTELYEQFASWPNLELRDRSFPPLDVWGRENEDTLGGIYFHMLRKDMKEHPENAERIRMAAEISRKLMLGLEVKL